MSDITEFFTRTEIEDALDLTAVPLEVDDCALDAAFRVACMTVNILKGREIRPDNPQWLHNYLKRKKDLLKLQLVLVAEYHSAIEFALQELEHAATIKGEPQHDVC